MNSAPAAAASVAEESCHALATQGDMLEFYNCYLRKFNTTLGKNILMDNLSLNNGETASLMVIDMQNDFILPPPGLATPPGRFSVNSGANIIEPFKQFIQTNSKKFHKIIFTRDTHTKDHCSFASVDGPFPPHCIANHIGAALHPDIKAIGQSLQNADVVFKGCFSNTDSFGGLEYKNMDYFRKRQLGNCCKENECSKNTGSFYLDNNEKKWEDFPFNFEKYEQQDGFLVPEMCPGATTENIQNSMKKEKFTINDIIPTDRDTTKTHYIFVMGLAGDYCVKDTALNIMKDPELPKNVKVVVIQPLSRYGFLPLQYIGLNQVYSNSILANTATNSFKKVTSKGEKDINHYLFKSNGDGTFSILTSDEAAAANTASIKHPWSPNTNANGKEILNANGKQVTLGPKADDFSVSNPNFYFAFLTPIKDILKDYADAGVQIVMTEPDMSALEDMAGGRRRGRRNGKKATRKQMKRKRQTYRRRR